MSPLKIADLPPGSLEKLKSLERELGDVYVIAYDEPLMPARLNEQQMAALQRAESEIGVCLVAYRKAV
jgi:hypothetical protein